MLVVKKLEKSHCYFTVLNIFQYMLIFYCCLGLDTYFYDQLILRKTCLLLLLLLIIIRIYRKKIATSSIHRFIAKFKTFCPLLYSN